MATEQCSVAFSCLVYNRLVYSTEEIDKILQYKKNAQKAVTSKKQEKSAPKE